MAGLSVHDPLPFIFGILGNIISFMVYLAPIPTFWRIYKKKSTQGFQSVPYFVALFSASLWIYYALVKTDALLLITINSFGCVIEFVYLTIYLIYATRSARIFTIQMITLMNVVAFGLIVVLTQLLAHGTNRVVILGWICVGFSVCVFAAPLSIIRLVIRTKSVEFMPFWLSFFLTLSAIAWFAYGLFTRDLYVQLPNVLGFSFGVIQMILYIVYMKKSTVVEPTSPDQKVVIVDHAMNPSLVLEVASGGVAGYDEESVFDKKKVKAAAADAQGVELNPPV